MEKTRIDLSYLETFAGGDNALISEMMERFIIDAPEQLSEINTAINNNDWKNAYKSLHSFKSSVNFIAIQPIKDLVLSMEKMAKEEHDTHLLSDQFALLQTECNFLIDEIKINLL
ncbi:Hpt domain-containing protein [Flammeovirga sp. SubArs3]|uniref:Hpt domain-containing protein n=1 Tax=Flammeovirga sp. SubArs3 TaxID=2995316 RepID=UPI00248D0BCE|nr:Hpt domain-containing protein [Flammeovirga sp. SubArs3]